MSKEIVQIKELPIYIGGLEAKLKEMQYAERSIVNHLMVLRRFFRFAESNGFECYDSFAVQKFIIAYNGDDFDNKYHSYRYTRPFAMLDDFIQHKSISRQKYFKTCEFDVGFNEYFTSFLKHLESRNYAEGSVKCCRSHLLRFQYLIDNGIKSLSSITHSVIRDYFNTLAAFSTTTSSCIARELKKLFEFLKICNFLEEDFSTDIPNFKNTRWEKLPDKFSTEEISKIIAAIDTNNPLGKRDYAIVLTAVRLGLRSCDVTALKFRSLDWSKKELRIIQRKTGVPLTLPLPDDVGWAIIDYIKNGRPDIDSEYVFVGHNVPFKPLTKHTNFVAIYMRKAGLYQNGHRRVGMHTLKRTLATSMLENDVPVNIIAQTLGHSDLNSIGNYIRISPKLLKKCAMEVNDFE